MCNELAKQDKIQEQIQVSAEQKLRVMNDQYVIHKMDETQYNAMASKISINAEDNIVRKNVRNAIIQNLGRVTLRMKKSQLVQ